jgi:hypothetical protein
MDFKAIAPSWPLRPFRLWFGIGVSFFAWFLDGVAEMFINWRACLHNEQLGNASSHPAASTAAFVVSFFLLALVIAGGIISFLDWRRLSSQQNIVEAEGRGKYEFVSLAGVLFSITLGTGMIWMTLPLFILRLCARVR